MLIGRNYANEPRLVLAHLHLNKVATLKIAEGRSEVEERLPDTLP
jgi:hypothetical protein